MRFLLLFFLFINSMISFGQSLAVSSIPDNLKIRANAVVRNELVRIEMKSINNVLITKTRTITILNESALEHARITEYYDKSTEIKSIKGDIYDANGNALVKFSLAHFSDESAASSSSLFESFRVKHFLPGINQFPFTIAYKAEIKMNQNLLIRDWTPHYLQDISIENAEYQFISMKEDVLNIQTANFNGTHSVTEDESNKINKWNLKNIPATRQERLMPLSNEFVASIKIAPQNFSYFNKKGTYNDWKGLGKWVYDNLLKDKRVLSIKTTNEIDELIKGINDKMEIAKILYAYMQNRTRYVSIQIGIGGFEPAKAEEVDRLRYGDCKALVNYMQALLEYAGIKSYYCVVEAGYNKVDLDPNYASMAQGNHVILAIPLKNEMIWLECTDQNMPFGFLSGFTDDRNVLAISENGGEILRTPKLTTEMNIQKRAGQLKISDEGDVNGQITTSFSGYQFDNHSILRLKKNGVEQEKILKSLYDINNIEFIDWNYQEIKDLNPTATENLWFTINGYSAKNNGRFIFLPNIFNIQSSPIDYQNRQFPIKIYRGYIDEDNLTFELPKGAKIDLPKTANFTSAFGSYQMSMTLENDKMFFKRQLRINEGTFPASSYNEYFKFMNSVRNADLSRLFITFEN